jgi:hypothetical protein
LLWRIKRIIKTGAIQAAIQTGLSHLNIESENAIIVVTKYSPFSIHFFVVISVLLLIMIIPRNLKSVMA